MSKFFTTKKLSVLIAVFILLATITSPVFAAGKMKSLEVQVWPEYDQPSVLIMSAGQGIDGAKNTTIYYPKGTEISKVLNKIITSGNENPDSFKQKYTTKETANGIAVSFDIPRKQYFSEGYWDAFKGQKTQKSFTFNLKLPMDIDNVSVYVQQPASASNFSIDPKPHQMQKDQANLSIAAYQFQNKKAGEVIPFKVKYTKTDNALSIDQANRQASQTTSKSSPSTANSDVTIIMLVILGLVFLVIGGFAFYNYKQKESGNNKSSKKPMKTAQNRPAHSKLNYCPNCGAKAEGKFCAKCGERL